MSHFAKVENGIVTQVIVADQDVINSGLFGAGWVQTSYNTHAGVHSEGGTPMRMNYAGIGYVYDIVRDAFYSPSPFPSWILDDATCIWQPPIPRPSTGMYYWDEPTLSWVEHTL